MGRSFAGEGGSLTPTSCEGCKCYDISLTYVYACYRARRMASGTVLKAPPRVGFPTEFETGHPDLIEGRADGDHCGPERRNYVARVGA
jgi:hypothetical protein